VLNQNHKSRTRAPARQHAGRCAFRKLTQEVNMVHTLHLTLADMSSSQSNAQELPLHRLPPELHNSIWTLCVHKGLVCVRDINPSFPFSFHRTYRPTVRPSVAFLRACRQIYTEAALLAFAINLFALPRANDQRSLLCALNLDQYQAIGKVQVSCAVTNKLERFPCLELA